MKIISTILSALFLSSVAFGWGEIGGGWEIARSGSVFTSAVQNGQLIFGVRNDLSTVLAPSNLGYGPLAIDSQGRLISTASVTVTSSLAELATAPEGSTVNGQTVFKLIAGRDINSIVHAATDNTDGSLWVDASHSPTLPLPTGAATAANQTFWPLNTTGSGSLNSGSSTVSTVTTIVAPANAAGFILEAMQANTSNIRWSIGRTATTSLGQQLQPGRDTGFVPCEANISICAEGGTQTYDIQWVTR